MFLFVVLNFNGLYSQQPVFLKNFLTIDNGLSNNEVTSIVQDKDGFIWIGTRGGLNQYDGYNFKVFNQIPGDSNSLVNPSIESLFVDSKGKIWIGTKSGGVSKYDPVTGKFKNIVHNYSQSGHLLPDNRILCFHEDGKGRIWMGTWDKGLVIYDEQNNTSQYFLSDQVNSIVETTSGKVWVGSGNGLFTYNDENNTFVKSHDGVFQEIKYDDKENVLWLVGIEGTALKKLDLKNNKLSKFSIHYPNNKNFFHNYHSLLIDGANTIWVGTWGTGFYAFDIKNESFNRYLLYPDNRAAINKDYDAILDIFKDRDGNIWLGTNGGGVCVLTQKMGFNSIGFHPEPNKGLQNTRIMSVVEDAKGRLWLGTIGNGLYWSPDRENIYQVPNNLFNDERFFIIKYIYEDDSGVIWVGTNHGTFNIEFNNGLPQLVNLAARFNNPIFRQTFVSFVDAGNMLWLGSLQGGLYLTEKGKSHRVYKSLFQDNPASGELKSDRISFLLKDSKERVWIGTYNGLHIFNPKDTTVLLAESHFKINGNFTGNIITCINEDKNGTIWIGTPNGLNRLTETSSGQFQLQYFTEKDGLASNFIKGITHDFNGNIWVSTNIGISKFVMNEPVSRFVNFDETDGVNGKNFTEASVFRNQKGEIFFGGSQGLTFFNPDNIIEYQLSNKPIFTGLKVLNQSVEPGSDSKPSKILQQSITHSKKIELSYKQNNFEIEFSALDFKSVGKNQYKYLLENHDENWNFIGNRHFINFNSLRPGEYTLKVKSANGHNVWNEEPAQLIIHIRPPFWRSWYALVFYVLIVIGIVSIIRWNAMKQVRLASSLEMEKFQHEKEQKINELKLQFFTNISHEFRTPLTLILAPLKEMLGKDRKNEFSDEMSAKIQIIHKNALRLMKLVNQLLDFRKAETGNMKLQARNLNIEEFTNEVCYSFFELAKINEIKFDFHSKLKTKDIWFDPEKLEIILNNLISNAFKIAREKGKIEVALYEEEDVILLSVSDNGIGISPAEINHIFDRFYRIERGENYGSSGIGLALVKRLVELHHGTISVTSEPNVNTEFVVSLQKGNNHMSESEMVQDDDASVVKVGKEQIFSRIFTPGAKPKPNTEECILVVEDNPDINKYLVDLLQPFYHVESSFDGYEGYKKALSVKPDLIVSDIMMPKMDGFELCQRVKSNEITSTIPIVLLTAKTSDQYRLLGVQSGADEYISKPFDPDYFLGKIRNLILAKNKYRKQFSKSVRLEPTQIEINPSEEVFIEKTISVIEKNLQNDNFSSTVLASELNMSNSSMYRKLKDLTGSSTAEFIRSIRIKRAAQLMSDKERTISEIAFEVGFNDVKHFRTVFQRQFGCSPSEFRDKL